MYEAVTRGIRVRVTPQYLEEESSPDEGRFFWAYTIDITNEGSETVQLRSRHWRITDGDGHTEEVRGPGVVGKTPVLKPGDFVPLHLGLSAGDAVGHHGRQLPDDDGGGRAVRRGDPRLLARQPARQAQPELKPDEDRMSPSVARRQLWLQRSCWRGSSPSTRRATRPTSRSSTSSRATWPSTASRASACRRRTGRRRACSPPSAPAMAAASRSRATPTWCRWPARPGTPIRSRWSSATASSTAAAPAT